MQTGTRPLVFYVSARATPASPSAAPAPPGRRRRGPVLRRGRLPPRLLRWTRPHAPRSPSAPRGLRDWSGGFRSRPAVARRRRITRGCAAPGTRPSTSLASRHSRPRDGITNDQPFSRFATSAISALSCCSCSSSPSTNRSNAANSAFSSAVSPAFADFRGARVGAEPGFRPRCDTAASTVTRTSCANRAGTIQIAGWSLVAQPSRVGHV